MIKGNGHAWTYKDKLHIPLSESLAKHSTYGECRMFVLNEEISVGDTLEKHPALKKSDDTINF